MVHMNLLLNQQKNFALFDALFKGLSYVAPSIKTLKISLNPNIISYYKTNKNNTSSIEPLEVSKNE
jgi:hypothetical protein